MTVFKSALKKEKKEISKFGIANKIAAEVKYSLTGIMSIGMFGKMCYNIETNKYDFYPSYLGESLIQIYHHIKGQGELNRIMMIFSGAIFVTIGVVFSFPSIKKILIRLYEKYWEGEILNQNYYRNCVTYSADPSHHLTCIVCNRNNVEVSYECGHVCICSGCHAIQ